MARPGQTDDDIDNEIVKSNNTRKCLGFFEVMAYNRDEIIQSMELKEHYKM